MLGKKRRVVFFQIIPLLLTTTIAAATCLSTYFSYRTAFIAAEQNDREVRKEFIEWLALLQGSIDSVRALKEELDKEKGEVLSPTERSNTSVQPVVEAPAD